MAPLTLAIAVGATLGACDPVGHDPSLALIGTSPSANVAVQTAYPSSPEALAALEADFQVSAGDTVRFETGSATLDPAARETLAAQARWIKAHPAVRMTVTGHADLVGSPAANQALGQRRAAAVVRYLVGQGVSRTRIDAVASAGDREPVVPVQGPEPQNRRAETVITSIARGSVGTGLAGAYVERVQQDYLLGRGTVSDADSTSDTGG